jgi:hypothetical protein
LLRISCTPLALIASIGFAATVAAQSSVYRIDFDENGLGFVIGAGANDPVPLTPLGNRPDPFDPTNGLNPLVYQVPVIPPTMVPGDIVLAEIAGGPASDLLRFTGGNQIVVYSELAETGEAPDLADVGLPTSRQTNLLNLVETGGEGAKNGLFGYTPTPNQPGYIAPGVLLNFTSDVPEPAAAATATGIVVTAVAPTLLRRPRR